MLFHHGLGRLELKLGVFQAQQCPGMALGGSAVPQDLQHLAGELQQPQLIGHRRLGFADSPGGLLLGEVVGGDQLVQRQRLLPEVQVFAL